MDAVEGTRWGDPPGILRLLDLAEKHRAELDYDWRTRFGLPFAPPAVQSWGEACRLAGVLAADPSSHFGAALAGWQYPMSREALATADLIDLFAQANSKKGRKPDPYPRPWHKPKATRMGRATRPQSEIRAALAARGHH